jgi:hypothetical protein
LDMVGILHAPPGWNLVEVIRPENMLGGVSPLLLAWTAKEARALPSTWRQLFSPVWCAGSPRARVE